MEEIETAHVRWFDSEMLECSAEDASGGLAYDSKHDVVLLKPGHDFLPAWVHLKLWDQGVDLIPIDGLGLLQISYDSCTEEGFIEVSDETFDLGVVLCLVHMCICFGVHFSYTLKSGPRYAET